MSDEIWDRTVHFVASIIHKILMPYIVGAKEMKEREEEGEGGGV